MLQTGSTAASSTTPNTFDELTKRNIETIALLESGIQASRTTGDKIADSIAGFCGSITFVWVHILWFCGWIVTNVISGVKHIDPFPFSLLTLITSLESIFLTTFVLISQNYQSRTAERRNHLDLQINLLAEQENSKMLKMLSAISRGMQIPIDDEEALAMQEMTRPDKIAEQIVETIEGEPQPEGSDAHPKNETTS